MSAFKPATIRDAAEWAAARIGRVIQIDSTMTRFGEARRSQRTGILAVITVSYGNEGEAQDIRLRFVDDGGTGTLVVAKEISTVTLSEPKRTARFITEENQS